MRFAYKAVDMAGHRISGMLDAINPGELEMRLKRMNLELLTAKPASLGSAFGRKHISRRDLIGFCFHLEQLSSAGVPILEGLADLRDSLEHPHLRLVAAALLESIAGGQTLSQAMAEHPAVFSRIFVHLVRAGESTGELAEILKQLTESLKWEDELVSQTRKLLLYPSLVAGIVLTATVFLMIYMVPQLKLFVKNMGQPLPLHSQLLFFVSELLTDYWAFLLTITAIGIGAFLFILRRSPAARRRLDAVKLRLPLVGTILNKIALSRFASTFAMFYAAGIPVLESIESSSQVVGNRAIRQAVLHAQQSIREGGSISASFADSGLFPALVIRMLHIGESTGKLDTALLNISYFYNRDVREAVAKGQSMIEPVLTICMGLLLAWIMMSVIGPIYDVISRIKQ